MSIPRNALVVAALSCSGLLGGLSLACDAQAASSRSAKPAAIVADPKTGIFVAPSGLDTNPGTASAPVRSLSAGAALAIKAAKPNLWVQAGHYGSPSGLPWGLNVTGGFDASWNDTGLPSSVINDATTDGAALVIDANKFTDPFGPSMTLSHLAVVAKRQSGLSSLTGISLVGPAGSATATLSDVTVTASGAAAGNDGAPFDQPASHGIDGGPGHEGMHLGDDWCADPHLSHGKGGAGARGVDPTTGGGHGGNGGCWDQFSATWGMRGMPLSLSGSGGGPGYDGKPGTRGLDGTRGRDGSLGSTGANASGAFALSPDKRVWSTDGANDGDFGQSGTFGGPGGGGGGGGADSGGCDGGLGAGGGGGASGGAGGAGGRPGEGGGGAIGIIAVTTNLQLINRSSIIAGDGGAGGRGALGQPGGTGGNGGTGGHTDESDGTDGTCGAWIAGGGNGGNGGTGGTGGSGGGGAGGASIAVVMSNGHLTKDSSLTLDAGSGGLGGLNGNDGTSRAATGPSALTATLSTP
ncbi:hypothetical protein AYO39_01600 [Actinobacteria bacterium SCGC AG-212-D09]|nr:hypothetical protein AYO39_01600 [Actinobacteria bacterium SCGC AG-212-D09]